MWGVAGRQGKVDTMVPRVKSTPDNEVSLEVDDLSTLFPMLTGEISADFERESERMEFSKGEQLYEQGFPCPFVPFIVSGVVRVFKIGESGREITLYRVHPGQVCILSSTCSISDKQYPAIAEAEEPAVVYVGKSVV